MNPITAAGFFDAGQPGYYLLILAFLAALVGLYLWGNRHKDSDSRAARLGRLYRELDEDKLAGIPGRGARRRRGGQPAGKAGSPPSGSLPYHSPALAGQNGGL